jgi:hypothetical protein
MAEVAAQAAKTVPMTARQAPAARQALAPAVVPRRLLSQPGEAAERSADARAARALSGVLPAHNRSPRQRRYPPSDTPPAIAAQAEHGRPLPPILATDFGRRLGADLRHVRIHDDAVAAVIADTADARAFTLGSHVFFNQGEYEPSTQVGRALLAHELGHLVQQSSWRGESAGEFSQVPNGSAVSPDQAEAEGIAAGHAAARRPSISTLHAVTGPVVQCASGGDPQTPTVNGFELSRGSLLEQLVRGRMERWFGADFARVRVHTDLGAQKSAEAMGAAAYTVGEDIVFGPGKYTPASAAGARLLAHELTHVVQQQGATPADTLEAVRPSDSSEAEAYHAAPASRLSRQAIQMAPATAQQGPIAKPPGDVSIEQGRNLLRSLRLQVRDVRDRRHSVAQPPELSPLEHTLRVEAGLTPPYTKSVDPYLEHVDLHLKELNDRLDEIDGLLSEADKLDGVARKLRLASAGQRMLALSFFSQVVMLEIEAVTLALYAIRGGWSSGHIMQLMAHVIAGLDSLIATEDASKLQAIAEYLKAWAADLKVGADISRHVFAAADAAMVVSSLYEGAAAESTRPPSGGPLAFVAVSGQVTAGALSAEWLRAVLDLIASGALDPAAVGITGPAPGSAPVPPGGAQMAMAGPVRTRDFEPPVRDHRGVAGGEIPENAGERKLAVDSWSREELESAAQELEGSIAARQAEQRALGETSVGRQGQRVGAAHRVRIDNEVELLRAIRKKLSGS